jgi:hypothetical protein
LDKLLLGDLVETLSWDSRYATIIEREN